MGQQGTNEALSSPFEAYVKQEIPRFIPHFQRSIVNTGHDGSLSTGHANSTHDMLSRLETMVLQGADGLPLEAIRQQIASAVDIIVHLSRLRDHSRKTMEITEVLGYRDGEIQLNPLYVFEEDENSTLEKVSGSLVRTKNPLVNDYKLKLAGINQVI